MAIEVQEQEMIVRFADGLSKAASRAKEMITAKEQEKPGIFIEFINGLKVAAGSAHQLAIYQENPNFLSIRDKIEAVIDVGQTLPVFRANQNGMWFQIKNSLLTMSEVGCKMATSKAMKRVDVLANLAFREQVTRAKNDGQPSQD